MSWCDARACKEYIDPATSKTVSGSFYMIVFQIRNCGTDEGNFFQRILIDGAEVKGFWNKLISKDSTSNMFYNFTASQYKKYKITYQAGHSCNGSWITDYSKDVDITFVCGTSCESSCQTACELSCEGACEASCQTTCEKYCQTGCEVSCETTCESSCQSACEAGCENYCENVCQTGCQINCQTDCELGCLSCQLSCMIICQNECEDSCQNICENSCESACELSCQTECQVACETGCEATCELACLSTCEEVCQTLCQIACEGTCEDSCEKLCQLACQISCETPCEKGCESGCQISCELFCQNACESQCQTVCEGACEDACEISCEEGCQIKCETACEDTCQASCLAACETSCQTVCEMTSQSNEEETRIAVVDIETSLNVQVTLEAKLTYGLLHWDIPDAPLQFKVDGVNLGDPVKTDSNGVAKMPYLANKPGLSIIEVTYDGLAGEYQPSSGQGNLLANDFSLEWELDESKENVLFSGICTYGYAIGLDGIRLYSPDFARDLIIVDDVKILPDYTFSCSIPAPKENTRYYMCRCWSFLNFCETTLLCGEMSSNEVFVIVDETKGFIQIIIDALMEAGLSETQAKVAVYGSIIAIGASVAYKVVTSVM